MSTDLKSYLKKSTSTGLCNSVGSALFSVIFIPLIIARLGLQNYGIWAVLMIFVGISGAADLGLSKSLVYFLPKQKDQKEKNEIFSVAVIINSLVILLLILAGVILHFTRVNIWGSNDSITSSLGTWLLFSGIAVTCLSLASTFLRAILEAHYNIHIVNIGFLLLTVLNYTTLFILTFFTKRMEYFLLNTVCVYLVIFLFHVVFIFIKTDLRFQLPKLDTAKEIFKYTFGFFSIGFTTSIVLPTNRYLIVLLSTDAALYAIFDVAVRISNLALNCLQQISLPLFSLFSKYGKESLAKTKKLLFRYSFVLVGGYALGMILFLLTGRFIIDYFLSKPTPQAFTITLIILSGIGLTGISEPFMRALFALGNLQICLRLRIIQIIINFGVITAFVSSSPLYVISSAYSIAVGSNAILIIAVFCLKYCDRFSGLRENFCLKFNLQKVNSNEA